MTQQFKNIDIKNFEQSENKIKLLNSKIANIDKKLTKITAAKDRLFEQKEKFNSVILQFPLYDIVNQLSEQSNLVIDENWTQSAQYLMSINKSPGDIWASSTILTSLEQQYFADKQSANETAKQFIKDIESKHPKLDCIIYLSTKSKDYGFRAEYDFANELLTDGTKLSSGATNIIIKNFKMQKSNNDAFFLRFMFSPSALKKLIVKMPLKELLDCPKLSAIVKIFLTKKQS